MEAGYVILMRNDLRSLVYALKLSRRVLRKIKENMFFALIYNVLAIPVAAGVLHPLTGSLVLPPTLAAVAMVLSDLTVVSNSLMLKRFNRL